MKTSETMLKEANTHIDQLMNQLEKEHVAYEHTIERQKVKFSQENQTLLQKVDVLKRDKFEAMKQAEELENVLERQRSLFETKILSLKGRVKNYKTESLELK
jgi:hypothetical protein